MPRLTSVEQLLEFKISNFNTVAAVIGGFLSLFGLVSYLIKEKFYLSEALISLLGGVVFSPHATGWIRPLEYALYSEENLNSITLYFTRLTLGVQLVLAGIQLPSRYLRIEWKSLSLLLGPVMCAMWVATSLLVWAMVPHLSFLHALAVGACVTPTDPVLSNSIVKGKFADKNIPKELQKVIIAESGANDGLGYPFLFLALYLIRYVGEGGRGQDGNGGTAIGYWFGITWGYVIILSIIYGIIVGYVFRKALRWAESRKYVDRESFLVFAITIALFIVGTMGMIGSDDVLSCFIAGNVFTWDDWFRIETEDDSFQPTIDMLLNVTIFAWYGAVCPWASFVHNNVIPIYRLIFLGVLVLLFRRMPAVFALHKKIHQIEGWRQASYVGFFGPIGVSAVFYLYTSVEYLAEITVDGVQREDAARLSEVITVVVWFMAICSIVVHGLTIPLSKAGFYLPRTLSRALSTERVSGDDDDDPEAPQLPWHADAHAVLKNNRRGAGAARTLISRSFGRSFTRSGSRSRPPSRSATHEAPGSQQQRGIFGIIGRPRPTVHARQSDAGAPASVAGTQDDDNDDDDDDDRDDRRGHTRRSSKASASDLRRPSTPPKLAERRKITFPGDDNMTPGTRPPVSLSRRESSQVPDRIPEA